jgi:hypothetical protein
MRPRNDARQRGVQYWPPRAGELNVPAMEDRHRPKPQLCLTKIPNKPSLLTVMRDAELAGPVREYAKRPRAKCPLVSEMYFILWAAFVFIVTGTLALPDWTIATPIAAVGALVIWIFGGAARHFLTRR